jgi:hypothetical protein
MLLLKFSVKHGKDTLAPQRHYAEGSVKCIDILVNHPNGTLFWLKRPYDPKVAYLKAGRMADRARKSLERYVRLICRAELQSKIPIFSKGESCPQIFFAAASLFCHMI